MKTKTIFLWMLLLMLVGGVNGAWGDTYKLILNSKPFTETKNNSANTGFFSVAGDYNINSKFNGATYDGITFSNGLKLEANKGDITFSCSAATVTIIQSTWSNKTIFLDSEELSPTDEGVTTGSGYYQYTKSVAAGTHTIKRGSGEAGLFFVQVEQSSSSIPPTSYFDYGSSCLAVIPANDPSTMFNNTFRTNSTATVAYSITAYTTTGTAPSIDSSTGEVTVYGPGTVTVQAHTDAVSGTFDADTKTYTLTVKKAEEYTIDVTKLKIPNNINANRNIDRTIPRLDISFGGGDGVKFNSVDEFYFRYTGSVTLTLRKEEEEAQMTKIVLVGDFRQYDISSQELSHYIQANNGELVKTSDTQLTWNGYADAVTFSSKNTGAAVTISDITFTTNGYALDASKVTPSFSFSPTSQQALASSSQNYNATLTSTPGFITGAIVFDAGDTGTTQGGTSYTSGTSNTVYTLTSGSTLGTATLRANYTASGDDYFNSSEASATYSLIVGASLSELPTFAFNYQEALYQGASGNKYVNCANGWEVNDATHFSFVYDPSYTTLKTKINLGTTTIASIGAEANSTYFTVESSDQTVLDVSEVSLQSASNGTRLYFNGIKVLKAGTVNLTYRFLGSATHAATSTTVAFTVVEPLTVYNGSYPFTWDFTGNATGHWNSSKLQMGYQGSSWKKDDNSAKLSTYTYVPDWNDVDIIKRLAITPSGSNDEEKKGNLYLNWGADKIWLKGTITIQNVSPDYVITIAGTNYGGDITATIGETAQTITAEIGTWTCTPNATGNLVITFPNTDITSIAVNRGAYVSTYSTTKSGSEIDGKIRDISGTFTFTGAGTITGGTQIKDVPGIVMTVGKSGTTYPWTVKDDGSGNICLTVDRTGEQVIRDQSIWIPTDGCFLKFSPYVNGYLTLNGHLYGGTGNDDKGVFMYGNDAIAEGNSNGISLDCREMETWTTDQTERTIGEPLLAGRTYYVYCLKNPLQLHSFTFRPAFLTVDDDGNFTKNESDVITSTEPSKTDADGSRYEAGLSKNDWAFPKLITKAAGQGLAKFAGDRTIVNLAANNDVDLLAKGHTIIKGTVLCNENDHELFTYYYLESKVLSVTGTTLGGSTIADQDYVDQTGAASYPYVFTFNEDIEKIDENFHVYVQIDGGSRIDFAGTPTWYTISGNTLSVNFTAIGGATTALEDGSTYRIVIPAGALKKNGDATIQNSEIVRTFSLNGDLEAPIKMIYPTGIASVGTSVVLETYVYNGSESIGFNDKHKVKARLKKTDGTGDEMLIDASFSGNRIIFKPTSTLDPNTDYTLKILANETLTSATGGQIVMKEFTKDENKYIYKVTKDKAFYFTTGATAGSVPIATGYSPANDPAGNVPVTAYSSGRISFTFDQNVELEPYSTVYATPINGDESTVSKEMMLSASDSGTKLFVDASGKTVYFDYVSDDLKYDLYYEVLMPVNTVVGAGGKPNEEPVKFRFRMAKNPNATPVDASEFYPHTWDFNKFGSSVTSTTSAYILADNVGEENKNPKYKVLNALQKSDQDFSTSDKNDDSNYDYRSFSSSGYGFDQGNDVYIATSATSTYKLPEFEGIRVSLAKSLNNRFAIRHTPNKNADNTDKYVFRMNGNTHYMTLSNVPAGKLYMIVNATHLGINSPNAVFETIDGTGYTLSNYNEELSGYTLLSTGGTKRVVIDVKEAGDVSFCVQNFNCDKIGVATESKPITDVGYATNARRYAVDYTLNNTFLDQEVTAYKVTGVSGSNATAVPVDYVPANAGVMLKAAGGADVSYPMFTWDYNQWSSDMESNRLVGVVDGESAAELPQKSANGKYNYILSTGGVNVKYNYEGTAGDEENQQGTFGGYVSGLAFYLVMKEGTILENGTPYAYEKPKSNSAYLQLDSYLARQTGTGTESGARQYFLIDFGDETTSVIGIEDTSKPSMSDDSLFSLQGVLVEKPSKGLYIRKGKKIVIK